MWVTSHCCQVLNYFLGILCFPSTWLSPEEKLEKESKREINYWNVITQAATLRGVWAGITYVWKSTNPIHNTDKLHVVIKCLLIKSNGQSVFQVLITTFLLLDWLDEVSLKESLKTRKKQKIMFYLRAENWLVFTVWKKVKNIVLCPAMIIKLRNNDYQWMELCSVMRKHLIFNKYFHQTCCWLSIF